MKKLTAYIFLLFLVPVLLGAQNFPSLEPLFVTEKISESLSPLELILYGLRFSTCTEDSESWFRSVVKFNQLKEKVTSSSFTSKNQAQRAQEILSLMYDQVLDQYKEQQTRLDVMFENGTYNCVSSAVLYLALAKAAGLKVVGVKTPSHAFCTVYIEGNAVDVETTNPFGYDPGRTQVLEQAGNKTKYAVIPKKNYSNRRNVSDRTLISLVGANMSSFWMTAGDYGSSVPMAATVMLFRDGENQWEKDDGRDTFDTVAMNYSVILDKKGQYLEAISWIDQVVERYGLSDKVRGELNGSVFNAVADLTNENKIAQAQSLFDSHNEYLSENFKLQCRKMIFLSSVQNSFEGMTNDQALEFVRSKYADEMALDKSVKGTLDKWQEFYWIEKINELNKAGEYLKAAASGDAGLKAMPQNYGIAKAKKSALYNYDAVVHNRMAGFANAKQYQKALEVIEEGLKNNPSSVTLQNDKKRLLQMMNR